MALPFRLVEVIRAVPAAHSGPVAGYEWGYSNVPPQAKPAPNPRAAAAALRALRRGYARRGRRR